jgi:tyrosyl-tRNA synthetase
MNKDFFEKGIVEVIEKNSLKKRLASGKKLRVKLGIDPTGPKLHIGRAISLWKLRELQDMGHHIVLIIGDFTAQIGDASDKTAERQILSSSKIKENMKSYKKQLGLILDMKKVELHYNSEWLGKMSAGSLLQETMNFTVNQMIKRENFWQRFKADKPIGLHEILYPLLQGYDSVVMEADVEVGGNDQLFNLLVGRTLQKKYGQKEQDIITFDLLEGTDGRKMSTSYGNCIYIEDEPNEMFGKVMSIKDDLIIRYMTLVTDMTLKDIEKIEQNLKKGMNPRDAKIILAKALVKRYHGEKAAEDSAKNFESIFTKRGLPTDIPEVKISGTYMLPLFLIELGAASSNSEARRLIEQGALKIDGTKITDPKSEIATHSGMVIQVGKKNFYKIK